MEKLLYFVNIVCFILTILIVWFKTNAFAEYCKLFNFKKILLGYEAENNSLTFPQYLYVKTRTIFECSICKFIVSLITCPICLSLWLCIIGACLYGTILLTPLFYITVLICYSLIVRIID